MPQINLIEEECQLRRRDERKSKSFFFLFVGSGVVAVGGYFLLLLMTEQSGGEIAKLTSEKARLAPLVSQAETNTKALAELQPKLDTLQSAQTTSQRWARVLDFVSHQTPPNVWLTSIRSTGTDATKPIVTTIIGDATSQTSVGEFQFRLENSTDLGNVTLKYTSERQIAKRNETEFQLDADIAGSAEQKPVDPKKDEKPS